MSLLNKYPKAAVIITPIKFTGIMKDNSALLKAQKIVIELRINENAIQKRINISLISAIGFQ